LRHCIYTCSQYLFFWTCRGYLVKTEAGKARLEEAGIKGAYLGPDGRVHIPGKRVTLYSDPSPTLEELQKVCTAIHSTAKYRLSCNVKLKCLVKMFCRPESILGPTE